MKNMMLLSCLMVTAGLLLSLSGCSSAPVVEKQYFVLAVPIGSAADGVKVPSTQYQVQVKIPAYLQHSGIVVATGAQRINHAQNHQWGEPLSEGITRVLQQAFVSQQPRSKVLPPVIVDVQFFHGDMAGNVLLDASYQFASGCQKTAYRFSQQLMQEQPGYAAMVSTQARLVKAMAVAIISTHTAGCR